MKETDEKYYIKRAQYLLDRGYIVGRPLQELAIQLKELREKEKSEKDLTKVADNQS